MCTAFEVGVQISFASKVEFDIYLSMNTFIEIGLDAMDSNFSYKMVSMVYGFGFL